MSNITTAIPQQNFELIRDLIGAIIVDELAAQKDLQTDPDLIAALTDVKVFQDRKTPFGKEEIPSINVTYFSSDFSNQNIQHVDGDNIYIVDVYGKAKGKTTLRGDKRSAIVTQRIAGLVRAIIQDPHYITLGVAPGTIRRVNVTSIGRAQIDDNEIEGSSNLSMYRVNIAVDAIETTGGILSANIVNQHDTSVKLGSTDLGLVYRVTT